MWVRPLVASKLIVVSSRVNFEFYDIEFSAQNFGVMAALKGAISLV